MDISACGSVGTNEFLNGILGGQIFKIKNGTSEES